MTKKTKYTSLSNKKIRLAINEPGEITNENIQFLGQQYLKKHQPGFLKFFSARFHKNNPVATELSEHNSDTLTYEKWLYLATVYENLERRHPSLSKSILKLFQSAFRDYSQLFKLLHHVHGNEGMEIFGYFSPSHIANTFKLMIHSYYYTNECMNEALYIQPTFHELNASSCADVTDDNITSIGQMYLNKYAVMNSNNLKAHSNHDVAAQIIEFNGSKSSYDKWIFLADCFAKLKSDDQLTEHVFKLFEKSFGNQCDSKGNRYIANPYFGMHMHHYFNNQDVARVLKDLVNEYFMLEYQKNLKHLAVNPRPSL